MARSQKKDDGRPIIDALGKKLPECDLPILFCEGKDNAFVAFHVAVARGIKVFGLEVSEGESKRSINIAEAQLLIAAHDGGAEKNNPYFAQQLQGLLGRLPPKRPSAVGFLFDSESEPELRRQRLQSLTDSLYINEETSGGSETTRFLKPMVVPESSRGAIESVILGSILQEIQSDDCLASYLNCLRSRLPAEDVVLFEKISVRTYLACKSPGNTGLNVAFKHDHVKPTHPAFGPIRDYILELIEPPNSVETT